MGAHTRRRVLAALGGVAILPLLAACPAQPEPEDCDADDLTEGDEDCDDLDGGTKKSKKPRSKSKTKSRRR